MTVAERRLWEALRRRQLDGVKFRSQHPIGRSIADFYCPAARLSIELDGPSHQDRGEYDQARTEDLKACGYRVLRIPNERVLTLLPLVLEQIRAALEQPHSLEAGPYSEPSGS